MFEHVLVDLASIVILGIVAQWLAWRLRFPSILFLLVFGFIAGPVTGFLHPDELMGDLLLPLVSISVAVILFEGGLTLKISELREIGRVVFLLISAGVVVTWAIAAVTAYYLLGLNVGVSVLLGAILVVTGPTVIGPLLMHIRPVGRVGKVLKWEGIAIDPVGALLAVLVFEAILVGLRHAGPLMLMGLGKTIFFGGLVALLLAGVLLFLLKRFWIPDFLQEAVALMLVIAAFVISNLFQEESGLFAVTLMGLVLANQTQVSVKHIVEFKENLRVLFISSLFILLAARLKLSDFIPFPVESLVFLAVLVFIARPASVFVSTLGSDLNWRERVFICWLAPRGIVAAAVSSVFALRLAEMGLAQAQALVPVTFTVIVGTVAIYGLTAKPLARWLGVAQSNPQGVIFVGAHSWACAMAKALMEREFRVLVIDSNRSNISRARLEGIPARHANVLSEHLLDGLDLDGIGRLLALTSNDEANSLAALHFAEIFESQELYQLSPEGTNKGERSAHVSRHLRGRFLFGEEVHYDSLESRCQQGWVVKSTNLTEEFDYAAFQSYYGSSIIPLFVITEEENLLVRAVDTPLKPEPGQTIVALVQEEEVEAKRKQDGEGDARV